MFGGKANEGRSRHVEIKGGQSETIHPRTPDHHDNGAK